MSLRSQLALVSLLLLCLPWAGCQYIRAVDLALQDLQESSLTINARSIAERLTLKSYLFEQPFTNAPDTAFSLYAHTKKSKVMLDGYEDENKEGNGQVNSIKSIDGSITMTLGEHAESIYFFIKIKDNKVNYYNPSVVNLMQFDHIIFRFYENEQHKEVRILASAPGNVIAKENKTNKNVSNVYGVWRENASGYQIEVEVNKKLLKNGFELSIVNGGEQGHTVTVLSQYLSQQDSVKKLELITESSILKSELAALNLTDESAYIINKNQYVLASKTGSAYKKTRNDTPWFISWFYRQGLQVVDLPEKKDFYQNKKWSFLDDEIKEIGGVYTQWYRLSNQADRDKTAVSIIVPLKVNNILEGYFILEKTTDKLLALTSSAFNRLFLFIFFIFVFIVFSLFIYASWLTWRVSRLNTMASQIINNRGDMDFKSVVWPELNSKDELGELSRSYHNVLMRLRESHSYLKNLSSKLSHELRTPIAIVRSSLENLSEVNADVDVKRYRERAVEGINRLNSMLNSMSSANRIEDSLNHADFDTVELNQFVGSLVSTYNDVYLSHQFIFLPYIEQVELTLSKELFVQLMDKIIDNAVSFSPANEAINITLDKSKSEIIFMVENKGPLLPESMKRSLFESMVSVRPAEEDSRAVHLGLGLYIAKIIAELHEGQIFAKNKEDESGVVFTVKLPLL